MATTNPSPNGKYCVAARHTQFNLEDVHSLLTRAQKALQRAVGNPLALSHEAASGLVVLTSHINSALRQVESVDAQLKNDIAQMIAPGLFEEKDRSHWTE